jgi:hypothetical protein
VNSKQIIPNRERLSIVIATILLAFALTQLISAPSRIIPISIGGIYLPINLDFSNIVAVAVALMTASGTDWILRDHPGFRTKSTIPNLLLPSTTSWVLYISLNNLGDNPLRWLIFVAGGLFLIAVILAEWTVLTEDSLQKPLAEILLTALAYALFLALLISLITAKQRLFISLATIGLASIALSIRVIQLQLKTQIAIPLAAVSMLVTLQIAAAMHYLPIQPLGSSLILLGTLYSTTNFSINLEQQQTLNRSLIEAGVPFLLLLAIALWLN